MRSYRRKTVTRVGYHANQRAGNGKQYFHLFLLLLLLCVVALSLVLTVRKCRAVKYDNSIWGSPYEEQLLALPSPSPTPKPREGGATPKYRAEYVQAYRGYEGEKTAYLTFDDGPTANITPQILDVLKEKDVKASFFVLGSMVEKNPEMAKRIAREGHILANHSYSHVYQNIYASVQNLLEEIQKTEEIIVNTVGEESYTRVFRFPGGSFEKKAEMKEALLEIDYVYVDWNALNGDAEGHDISVQKQLENLKNTTEGKNSAVILMHDAPGKQTTAEALPQLIDYLKEMGYTFRTLKR